MAELAERFGIVLSSMVISEKMNLKLEYCRLDDEVIDIKEGLCGKLQGMICIGREFKG